MPGIRSRTVPYHGHDFGVYVVGDNATLGCDVLEHFMERSSLDLLALQLRTRIVEVEHNGTLV